MQGKRPGALKRDSGLSNVIAERLVLARRRHEPPWSQDQLTEAVEVTQGLALDRSVIPKIEAQLRGAYDYEVRALALTLGVTADWLLGIGDDPAAPPVQSP